MCNAVSVGRGEVSLYVSFVMGHSACNACLHVTAKFGEYGQQNIWWPGGLSVVASALWGTHFGEGWGIST